MPTPSLVIAGIDLSIIGWLDFEQRIEPIGGSTTRRMASGTAFKMTRWVKHRIVLSGSGWVPSPLNAIDYAQRFDIELPYPEAFRAGESLPTGWASRAAPWGEVTVTDQAGVAVRLVYPKMTVVSDGPTKSTNQGAARSWELVCEVA